jgi:hypothetical protein
MTTCFGLRDPMARQSGEAQNEPSAVVSQAVVPTPPFSNACRVDHPEQGFTDRSQAGKSLGARRQRQSVLPDYFLAFSQVRPSLAGGFFNSWVKPSRP